MPVCSPLPIDSQSELCQWIDPVGVAAMLADQNLGCEAPQQRRDDGVNARSQPASFVPGGNATFTA